MQKIELMAPAGNFESLQAALDNGADSVYFGVEQLNMRARASINFMLDDLPEIAKRCQNKGVRTYLTLNTIIYDHDLSIVKTLIKKAKESNITAVIAMDQAVIMTAREFGMEVHISTQINITNIKTVKFYAMFADTMVLSRELSLRQVKKITEDILKEQIKGPSGKLVEIEIFGHGALCMAVSGKCYMSLHSYNSSANRGACKQNCRKKYTVIEQETGFEMEIDNEYIMSPKDLCTIDILDQVADAGIKVLKIEGRSKTHDYTLFQVVASMKLPFPFGRFYLGQKLGEWSEGSGSYATQKKVYIGKGVHYFPKPQIGEFQIEAYDLSVGDTILITGPTTGAKEIEVKEMMVNDKNASKGCKGDSITIPLGFRIRPSDKLYKIVQTKVEA